MPDLCGRRVLVTGAAGFLGANLVRGLLDEGARVHALVRRTTDPWRIAEVVSVLRLHHADLTDFRDVEEVFERVEPEVVFHCAMGAGHPRTSSERLAMLGTAVLGTAHVIEAAARVGYDRFVHFGSSLEYGPSTRPFTESDAVLPTTFRGASKVASSLLCRQHAIETGRHIVIMRLTTVYGPWERPKRLIPAAIRAALGEGRLRVTGTPCSRDRVYVDDVVGACRKALEAALAPGEVINVGSGIATTNEEVVDAIEGVCGRKIERVLDYPIALEDHAFGVADVSKAKRLLGWEPQYPLRLGLERTVAWFRLRGEAAGHDSA